MSQVCPAPQSCRLEDVLITEELKRRAARKNFAAENRALTALAQELGNAPEAVQNRLTDLVLELCHADSAGISLLESQGGEDVFRWTAAKGAFSENLGGTIPRAASPCGVVIERNETLLFRDSELYFPLLRAAKPAIHESLLAPFYVDGRPAGTVWAVKHHPNGRFDTEDARLLTSLSRFASAAYQAVRTREAAHRDRAAIADLHPRLIQVSKMATVGEITAGVAHELNQPLAAIANYAHASVRMLSRPEPALDEVRGALTEISNQALRAGGIIKELRQLAGSRAPQRVDTDINQAICEVLELMRAEARSRGVLIVVQLASDLQPLKVERIPIQHVVLNLVRNAIEALESAAPADREVVVATQPCAQGGIELTVSDTGPGLPEDVRARMFDPFFSTKENGTGLGLPISSSVVRAHGGTLVYEPGISRGARFRIRLPRDAA